MKKKYFVVPILAILIPFIFNSCEKIVDPPQADFSVTQLSSTNDITFSFTDWSSGSPDEWLWTFEGGYPSTSTEENPTVTYSESGTFDVTLVVTNEGGDDVITGYDYINIVQFNNPLFTDMDVTVGGVTKTMAPDSYVQFAQIYDYSVSYYAETFGETTSGTIVGEEIFWDETVSLLDHSSYNLILGNDFIFLYMTNSSGYSYYPLKVNWGTNYETTDYISIPSDYIKYSLGYYYAFYGMEVRAYLAIDPYDYDSWILNPPGTNNQYMELIYKKSARVKSDKAININSVKTEMLYPALETNSKMILDPNSKNLTPSNRK